MATQLLFVKQKFFSLSLKILKWIAIDLFLEPDGKQKES
jgi:hypothetical protein